MTEMNTVIQNLINIDSSIIETRRETPQAQATSTVTATTTSKITPTGTATSHAAAATLGINMGSMIGVAAVAVLLIVAPPFFFLYFSSKIVILDSSGFWIRPLPYTIVTNKKDCCLTVFIVLDIGRIQTPDDSNNTTSSEKYGKKIEV